ncbi:integrase arm-type DNA-binding domain-containing protein [Bradyrhizobium sp. 38]|uniref:tyrosine-type recombinase/integrase n=1 Tax=unclassified Bradyrhizobium TaxID=2631580 RepID=UPI001FF99F47|nr:MULTISPECIES: integrase arm-type DNA-binding domain-containing protein [unclassified Bradyrhizobium]MCK1337332.1 integrase arm-type DNA-binding domain-containing protein [Bradyrhizobium sp. 38]MCK1777451.1 integrase arm-type DNA-binding domain-containing protein [Bradyrhizobium sp. 132]
MGLTVKQVEHAKPGDRLGDGNGLWLFVAASGSKSWMLRFTSPATRKAREMGLGPASAISLAEARDVAQQARKLLVAGRDPIEERSARRAAVRVEASRSVTFEVYAKQYVVTHRPGWKNPKHAQQWENTLKTYVYPRIGATPIADVTTTDVVNVLAPIWLTKRETAARIRGRIEKILDAAKANTLRVGDNPALFAIVTHLLPKQNRKRHVKHHPALPHDQMPEFWRSLARDASDAARMLRWIILTACRYGEARGMTPDEIRGDLWRIPKGRMKAERDHYVPLTALALEQLPFRPVSDVALTTCIRRHTESPASTHGMRSTFRDWAGDETEHEWEVAEAALAHQVGDETELAYRRSTALKKRRELMRDWTMHCARPVA